jgi:hypothetical protein
MPQAILMILLLQPRHAHGTDAAVVFRQRKSARLDFYDPSILKCAPIPQRGFAWQFGSQTVLIKRVSDTIKNYPCTVHRRVRDKRKIAIGKICKGN